MLDVAVPLSYFFEKSAGRIRSSRVSTSTRTVHTVLEFSAHFFFLDEALKWGLAGTHTAYGAGPFCQTIFISAWFHQSRRWWVLCVR